MDAILLIAGTAIGAGVLGLPVALRSAGYVPALVGVASVYLLTLLSGILLAQLFIENHDKDLPTLFFRHLGKFGATLFNISYFTLAFCLLVAYWSCLCEIFGHMVPVVIAAGFLIYYGLRHRFSCLEKLNSILTTGLIISFAFFIFTIFRSHGQKFPLFEQGRWFQLPMALPVILCSFGYHQVIPLVCRQLNHEKKSIMLALSIGVFIPFLFNATILTAGFRMFTAEELSRAASLGVPIFSLLTERNSADIFAHAAQAFSFLAVATSMIGISMAMRGALHDVLGEWKFLRRSVEVLIVLPIVPAIFKPQLFFTVLGLAGGIFGNLIAGILPLTPFLGVKRFRVGYLLLWLAFIGIFAIECINLL